MGFSLRTITDASRFSENVRLNVLERAVPQATVEAVLVDLDATEQRTRKLPAALTTQLCVATGLFPDTALEQVESVSRLGLGDRGNAPWRESLLSF